MHSSVANGYVYNYVGLCVDFVKNTPGDALCLNGSLLMFIEGSPSEVDFLSSRIGL
jgi:hypothetical protein